jgi:alpha-beta hydrolase superfamily lysophospholipase
MDMETSTLSTYVALDGENIAIQDWPIGKDRRLRGVVMLVHGLGEHAGRYDHVARRLNEWGFAVRGYDQYGHGESGGVRGGLPSDNRLLDDLADVMDSTRARMDRTTPLILFGHSLGGLVAARHVSLGVRPVQGLVLSSPALDPGLNVIQKLLLAVLSRMAPDFRVGNGLNPGLISHDPAEVQAYRNDPLIHNRISGRLARFIVDAAVATQRQASHWSVPTLLLYAGDDKLVSPAGSRAFAAAAPTQVVSSYCFDGMYHEILNELDREPVFARLKAWLDARF